MAATHAPALLAPLDGVGDDDLEEGRRRVGVERGKLDVDGLDQGDRPVRSVAYDFESQRETSGSEVRDIETRVEFRLEPDNQRRMVREQVHIVHVE